jgi:hypothetical protein
LINDGGFKAEKLIIDGLDFKRIDAARLPQVKTFAAEMGIAVWYSCTVAEIPPSERHGLPAELVPVVDSVDVALVLEPHADYVRLIVAKNPGGNVSGVPEMRLDPKTMLLKE